MTYKSSILYDYPIAYYPLDESGSAALDYSGCENDGTYTGSFESNLLPLLCGPTRASKITSTTSIAYSIANDYSAASTDSKFATASSSDNDFTIEFWFYPQITTTNETILVADNTNDVGVFYQKGNIIFKLDTQTLEYTLPSTSKVFHIVCVYNQSYAYIYVDGELAAYKEMIGFKFTNTSLSLESGPTSNVNDYFLINSLAIYRYELKQARIRYHNYQGKSLLPTQVAQADNGQVFNIYDNGLKHVFRYEYPTNKSWLDIVEDGLYYYESEDYLEMIKTENVASSTVILNDFIPINPSIDADHSKIEWHGDNGVSVSISTDGVTYTSCVNGQQIPGYTINSFAAITGLYIRITMSSTDTSRFIPRLYKLCLTFYNGQNLAAENGYAYISSLEGDNAVSDYRITFGNYKYDILSRHKLNGLKTVTDSGFHVTTFDEINTVEFFYTPDSLTDSGLISTTATNGYSASTYRWSNSGTISKTNISAIYVNGVNKTSQTNVSNVFKAGQLHHVIIVFGSAVSGEIRFNHSLFGSVPALYQYISIYLEQFDSTKAGNHYTYYINRDYLSITDTSTLTMTEDAPSVYNNDWIVIQNV